MPSLIGFGRRLIEVADLKLRAAAGRHQVESVRILGVDLRFRCSNATELARVRTQGGEPVVFDMIRTSLKAGDCFYDIGANTGFYSVLAARIVGAEGRVVAFEPEGENFSHLFANVVLNQLANLVTCPFGLSDHNGSGFLRLQSATAGEGGHALMTSAAPGTTTILLLTLDTAIDTFDLPEPTHIKIDVEGHEEEVFAGMQQTLAGAQLRSVTVEVHYYTQLADRRTYLNDDELETKRSRIVDCLESHGFELGVEQLTAEGPVRFAHMVFARRP